MAEFSSCLPLPNPLPWGEGTNERSRELCSNELRQAALHWLAETDAAGKAAGVRRLAKSGREGGLTLDRQAPLCAAAEIPGRPDKPELVAPRHVKRRSMITLAGRAALIHALVHIEFNAINLALDAIWRFPDMPQAYYVDWLQVLRVVGCLPSVAELSGYTKTMWAGVGQASREETA
jgi:hypothetical protein